MKTLVFGTAPDGEPFCVRAYTRRDLARRVVTGQTRDVIRRRRLGWRP